MIWCVQSVSGSCASLVRFGILIEFEQRREEHRNGEEKSAQFDWWINAGVAVRC